MRFNEILLGSLPSCLILREIYFIRFVSVNAFKYNRLIETTEFIFGIKQFREIWETSHVIYGRSLRDQNELAVF